MQKSGWALGVAAMLAIAGSARAQVAPPDAPGGIGGAGESAASPGMNMGVGGKADGPRGPLVLVRANQTMTVNALIGSVNHVPIFVDDVLRPLDDKLKAEAEKASDVNEFKQVVSGMIRNQLSILVSDVIVVSTSEATLSDNDRKNLEFVLNKQRHDKLAEYGGSWAATDKALRATGSSLDKYMDDRRREFLKGLYFSRHVMPNVSVTVPMVIDAYKRDPAKDQPATVELYTITLPVSRWLREPTTDGTVGPIMKNPTVEQIKSAEAQAMAEAKSIAAEAKKGKDWAVLVEDHHSNDRASDTGGRYLEPVKKGRLKSEKLETLVFSLPANTIGEPLLLHEVDFRDSAVVVVKVGKKEEARTVPFEEMRDKIKSSLEQQQRMELYVQEVGKLYTNMPIESVDKVQMLNVAVEVAIARYATK